MSLVRFTSLEKIVILPAADRRVLRETLFASKAQGGDSFVRECLKDIADGERSSHFIRLGGTAPA